MKKKVLALLLAMVMVLSLAACGKKPANTNQTGVQSVEDLEPVTIKMWFHGSNVSDDTEVVAAINDYLKDKINATFEPIWGTWGDFDTKAVMSLEGSEDVDIYFTCSWSADEYNKFAREGYWVRLDDPANNLIEKYAADLWKTLPDVLTQGAAINGSDGYGVYAVPGYKDIATQNCWDVNVPLLTKYGYTLKDIENAGYYGLGDILAKVKAGEGDSFYPLLVEGAVLERMATNSIIVTGDSGTGNFMSYYLDPNDVSKPGSVGVSIVNKFATPEYKKFVEKTHEYYQAGYIDPGCANPNQANELRTQKQMSGEYLIGTQSYSLGYELQASQERGFEVAMVPCTDAYVDTTSSQGAMMAISTASKNPERAMMFLNLLNTDPTLMMMVNYGLNGVHYNLENGLVKFTDKRSTYQPWTNGVGNVTLLTPTVDQGAGFWDGFKAYYGAAKEIPLLGFSYNGEANKNVMGAVANVVAEYMLALDTGAVDPAEKLPEFLAKLEKAGINTIIDDVNSQLKTFMDAKNK